MKNYLSPNAEFANSSLMPDKMLIFKPINLEEFHIQRSGFLVLQRSGEMEPIWSRSGAGSAGSATSRAVHNRD